MYIRQADLKDLSAIAAIESCGLSPWSATQIEEEILHKLSITLIVTGKDVAKTVGWCNARVVPPECELLKISVLPRYRKRGFGTFLLVETARRCFDEGCLEMYLEVRESNNPARTFYKNSGFLEQGRRKAYYNNPVEDAILMKKPLGRK